MRQGPTRSMIARRMGSDFLRWWIAFRMSLPAKKDSRPTTRERSCLNGLGRGRVFVLCRRDQRCSSDRNWRAQTGRFSGHPVEK